jgi:hypothetical protein
MGQVFSIGSENGIKRDGAGRRLSGRESAGSAWPGRPSAGGAGGFAGAIEALVKTTQSLTDIITAMAICWNEVIILMEDRRYYDAAKRIATDPRIKTTLTTRRLVRTIYLIALHDSTGNTKGDSRRIEEEFPFVIEALEPFPDFALPLPPEGAPKNDAAGST